VTHFPNKSTLPDPYDGLLEGVHAGDLNVHDCMGCALHVNGKLWGAITLDSLKAGVFDITDCHREAETAKAHRG